MPILNLQLGSNVRIANEDLVNLYGCSLGDDVFVGPFVEIQRGVHIGDRTRVSSHSFICEGVSIGTDCFIGHGVMFTNDLYTDSSSIKEWVLRKTCIGNNVRVGSNVTILPVRIGNNVVIGAGAVVTHDIPNDSVVSGTPARRHRSSGK